MIDLERSLDRLFERYRNAIPDPEPGAGFTPGIWRKIEARRGFSSTLRTYARVLISAAATACLVTVFLDVNPLSGEPSTVTRTYVEALNEDDGPEQLAYADVEHASEPGERIEVER
jgi:hypothetical protein